MLLGGDEDEKGDDEARGAIAAKDVDPAREEGWDPCFGEICCCDLLLCTLFFLREKNAKKKKKKERKKAQKSHDLHSGL